MPDTTSRRLVVGIIAHVDAGKTTLSEGMLYLSGRTRRLGRVDHGDTYLDTDPMERERGITIFSKQARLTIPADEGRGREALDVVLLDTPGHADFSAETERTFSVLDYAILVVSGTDGIRSHTLTLWKLLETYRIPTFLFINKMDQPTAGAQGICMELRRRLSDRILPFYPDDTPDARAERLASADERLMEDYFGTGAVDMTAAARLVAQRELFPCFFGSALKLDGVYDFMAHLSALTLSPACGDAFGGRVYKIARDPAGARLTYLKVTGGQLRVRDELTYTAPDGSRVTEKIAQLRLYSGDRYTQVDAVGAGDVCAAVGLSATWAGLGLGEEPDSGRPLIEPVLSYRVTLPPGADVRLVYPRLKVLEEEDPALHFTYAEELSEIHARLMGEVQTEVLTRLIRERLGLDVTVGDGRILYRETIRAAVEGVGHYEPLRHYAEVHVAIEPLPAGSGVVLADACPDAVLERNWRRLIMAGLSSRVHRGVLTGAPLTDVRVTLLCGRASIKHTDGGDFREAACRAVRHGLMQAESILLEPYYRYRLTVPTSVVGRAMTDMQARFADFVMSDEPSPDGEPMTTLSGRVPVSELRDYAREVAAYTRGAGRLTVVPDGYAPCHNADEVLAASTYDPEADLANPPHSVFCAHGAGFFVPWQEVARYMHMDSGWSKRTAAASAALITETAEARAAAVIPSPHTVRKAYTLSDAEMEAIMRRTFGPEKPRVYREPVVRAADPAKKPKAVKPPPPPRPAHVIVDGYNLIFQWDYLLSLARESLEAARESLMDMISSYAAFTKTQVTLVFDAYRVTPNLGKTEQRDGYTVVWTAKDQTADAYIEKLVHELGLDYRIRVVTSDGLVQVSALHAGTSRTSSREFAEELVRTGQEITAFIRRMSEGDV